MQTGHCLPESPKNPDHHAIGIQNCSQNHIHHHTGKENNFFLLSLIEQLRLKLAKDWPMV
jgi:hypothetical protein